MRVSSFVGVRGLGCELLEGFRAKGLRALEGFRVTVDLIVRIPPRPARVIRNPPPPPSITAYSFQCKGAWKAAIAFC